MASASAWPRCACSFAVTVESMGFMSPPRRTRRVSRGSDTLADVLEERQQDRVAPHVAHALEGLAGGGVAELRQEPPAVRVQRHEVDVVSSHGPQVAQLLYPLHHSSFLS